MLGNTLGAPTGRGLQAAGIIIPMLPPALPLATRRWHRYPKSGSKRLILLVPGERIELPTNGLQNRRS